MQARQEIAKLKMKYPDINGYIAKFEELAHLAKYNTGSMETIQLFLNGLDRKILIKVMGSTSPILLSSVQESCGASHKSPTGHQRDPRREIRTQETK